MPFCSCNMFATERVGSRVVPEKNQPQKLTCHIYQNLKVFFCFCFFFLIKCQKGTPAYASIIHLSVFFFCVCVLVNWEDLISGKFKPGSQADKKTTKESTREIYLVIKIQTSKQFVNLFLFFFFLFCFFFFISQFRYNTDRPDHFRFAFGKRTGELIAQEFPELFFLILRNLPVIMDVFRYYYIS